MVNLIPGINVRSEREGTIFKVQTAQEFLSNKDIPGIYEFRKYISIMCIL